MMRASSMLSMASNGCGCGCGCGCGYECGCGCGCGCGCSSGVWVALAFSPFRAVRYWKKRGAAERRCAEA
jgi:hypothetical protein